MNTTRLKSDLQRLIVETNDISILTKIYEYFSRLTKTNATDWWDTLTIEQQKSIEKGLSDYEEGNVHSDDEVRESIHKNPI